MAAPRNITETIFSALREGKYSGKQVSSVLDTLDALKPEELVQVLQGYYKSDSLFSFGEKEKSGLEMLYKIAENNPSKIETILNILYKVPSGKYNIPITRSRLKGLFEKKAKNIGELVVRIQELTDRDIIEDYVKEYQKANKSDLASDEHIKKIFQDMHYLASDACREKISLTARNHGIIYERIEPIVSNPLETKEPVASIEVDNFNATTSPPVEDKKDNSNPERKLSVTDFTSGETKVPVVSDSLDTTPRPPAEDRKDNPNPERKISLTEFKEAKKKPYIVDRQVKEIPWQKYKPFFESLTGVNREEIRLERLKKRLEKLDVTQLIQVLTEKYKTSQIEMSVENRAGMTRKRDKTTQFKLSGKIEGKDYKVSTRSGLSILLSNLPKTDEVFGNISKILLKRSHIPVDEEGYFDFTQNNIVDICNKSDLTKYLPTLMNMIKCDLLINNESLPLILLSGYLSNIKPNSTFNYLAKKNLIELIKRSMAIDAELKSTPEAEKTAQYPGYSRVIEQINRFQNNDHFKEIYNTAGLLYQRELESEMKLSGGLPRDTQFLLNPSHPLKLKPMQLLHEIVDKNFYTLQKQLIGWKQKTGPSYEAIINKRSLPSL